MQNVSSLTAAGRGTLVSIKLFLHHAHRLHHLNVLLLILLHGLDLTCEVLLAFGPFAPLLFLLLLFEGQLPGLLLALLIRPPLAGVRSRRGRLHLYIIYVSPARCYFRVSSCGLEILTRKCLFYLCDGVSLNRMNSSQCLLLDRLHLLKVLFISQEVFLLLVIDFDTKRPALVVHKMLVHLEQHLIRKVLR